MKGKCAKQEVIAIIENDGQYWVGTNYCWNAQKECPRKDMRSGEGYELCEEICNQQYHAEVGACMKAPSRNDTKGGTLYLLGHTYCCDDCKEMMKQYGIKKVIIGQLPKSFTDKIKEEF